MSDRRDTLLAVALVAVVALAPIPLGSNRPVFWMLWAVAIGLIGLVYGIGLWRRGTAPRLTFLPEALLLVPVLCYLVMQALPLAIAPSVRLQDGSTITPPAISLDPGSTLLVAINFANCGLLFLLFTQLDQKQAQRVLVALFAVVVAFAVYGLVSLTQLGDTLLGFEKLYYRGYATGTFVGRNSYATFLASGIAIGVALIARTSSRRMRLALIAAGTVFIVAALLATASRMGVVAAITGGGAALLAATAGRKGAGRLRVAFIAIAILLIAGLVVLYGAGLIDRIILGDAEGRIDLYRQVWAAIMQRPLLGYGGGSFAATFPLFQHAPLAGGVVWDKAHSSYLTLWFELGLIAGTAILLSLVLLGLRAARALSYPARRLPSAAAIGVLTVFAVHSLVDFSAEIEANAFLFIAVLALPAAGGKCGSSNAG